MRALVYSDLQATEGHERMFGDPTKSLQIWRVNKLYADLLAIYKQYECNALWDLGDTTDDRSSLPVPAIDAVCYGLSQFPASGNNIKLLGNHEQYLRNTKVNVGQMFSPYFWVMEEPTVFSHDEGAQILCAPYPAKEEELTVWVEKQRRRDIPTVLLGHFQISGCWGCSGQLLSGLTLDKLSWIQLGLLGHIHRPQQLGNCHYVGSPFQQDWGEAGEEKRVGIVDISGEDVSVSWVPLSGYPTYRTVGLQEYLRDCSDDCEDRFRVVLKSPAEAAEFYASKFAHRAEPQYDFDVSAVVTSGQQTTSTDTWTPENVMRRYMERNSPADRGIPLAAEDMLQYGLEIYTP